MTKICYVLTLVSCVFFSCKSPGSKEVPIQGTWHLLTGTTITKNDTVITDYTKGQKMIKIINESHFSFLRHDLSKGKDTAIYDGGGGIYSLKDDKYTELLEFCSYREWEGRSFEFTVSVSNDTLVQRGVEKLADLGVDRYIIEKYVRVK
mgnify:CR=1 FL=1